MTKLGMIVLILGIGIAVGWTINGWRLSATIASMKAEYATKQATAEQQYRQREQALQANADKLRKDKDAQINRVTNSLNDALVRLQQRQSRSEATDSTRTCSAADGTQLSREDAEFLTRLAAEADTAVTNLNTCVKQYRSLTTTK